MNVFRDSTASLLDRIHRLEKENARLRRHEHRRRRSIIRSMATFIFECIGIMLCITIALVFVTIISCLMIDIAHA